MGLGVAVELRSGSLTRYAAHDSGIDATVAGPDGRTVIVRAQYLVGADGARSTVRHLSGQQLGGSFAGEDVLLGDVEADHHYTRSHFHAFFLPRGDIWAAVPAARQPGTGLRPASPRH